MKEQLNTLIRKELSRANEQFPQFNSMHEAYSILLEEFEEGYEEYFNLKQEINNFWKSVKSNDINTANNILNQMSELNKKLLSEFIQVGAMIEKTKHFVSSLIDDIDEFPKNI